MPPCGGPTRDDYQCPCVVEGGEGVVVTGDGTPRQNPYVISLANPGPGIEAVDTDTVELALSDGDTPPRLTADVRISDTANNALMHGDDGGLYVHTDGVAIKPGWGLLYQTAPQPIADGERVALEWDAAAPEGTTEGPAITVADTGLWLLAPAARFDGRFAASRMSLWVANADNSEDRITHTEPRQITEPLFRPGISLCEPVWLEKGQRISVFLLLESGDTRETFVDYRATRLAFAFLGPTQ